MLIQSGVFLLFFCLVFCLTWLTPRPRRWLPLLAASLIFVAWRHPAQLLYLLLPTLAAYLVGRRLGSRPPEADPARRRWLLLGVALVLAALAAAKYLNFLIDSAAGIAALFGARLGWKPLALLFPVGVSFYSFRLLAYLVDVYHGRIAAERHPGYFGLFASFFPQISAGPIERPGRFLPLLRAPDRFDLERLAAGLAQIAWGFFKKLVVADRLGIFVDQVFAAPHGQGLNLIFAAWFYAFQIYCDFSGYTDIAIGLARLLGYESVKNFDTPYASQSIAEFWTRWHISLSNWLRDYLFLPVSYAVMRRWPRRERVGGVRVETWSYVTAAGLTMFLCGLWHGPAWTFVVWGLLHGLFMVVGQLGRRRRRRWAKRAGLLARPLLYRWLRVALTFNLVSFAWIFFRAPTLAKAVDYINYMQLKPGTGGAGHLLVSVVLVLLFVAAERLYNRRAWPAARRRLPLALGAVLLALIVALVVLLAVDTGNEFIYIRF